MLLAKEAANTVNKFIKRALWMTDPQSAEFRMYFLEMVTEVHRISGREFNADITIDDLKRTLLSITEKYPLTGRVSLNTLFKTVDTLGSFDKMGDLFSIAMAVSVSFLALGFTILGPVTYLALKLFAPDRLKCSVVMGIGGLLAIELYGLDDTLEVPALPLESKGRLGIVGAIAAAAAAAAGIAFFALDTALLYRVILGAVFGLGAAVSVTSAAAGAARLYGRRQQARIGNDRAFSFKIDQGPPLRSQFVLDAEDARFLFSMQYHLIDRNIEQTADVKAKGDKRIWLDRWKTIVENQVRDRILTGTDALFSVLNGPAQALSKVKRTLLFAESALFTPYFETESLSKIVLPAREKALSAKDLAELGQALRVNAAPRAIQGFYQNAVSSMTALDLWKKVIGSIMKEGIRMTVIADKNGPVRTSTMLALSGGKKLPKEALEAAQNCAFYICGGILVDRLARPLFQQLSALDSDFTLAQLAKLETAFRLLSQEQACRKKEVHQMLALLTETRDELIRLYNAGRAGRDEVKKSIHYFEVALKRDGEVYSRMQGG